MRGLDFWDHWGLFVLALLASFFTFYGLFCAAVKLEAWLL